MRMKIVQGHDHRPDDAHVNIVIDVIRAFTVAHYAFLSGVKRIILADSVETAFQIKRDLPEVILAGEIKGLPIPGFDLDNSPVNAMNFRLNNRILVQKTTNGVKAALNALNAEEIYVTGFSNAKITAQYVNNRWGKTDSAKVNIIASHPTGEDDLACAQYIKEIIEGSAYLSPEKVKEQIQNSHVAQKFYDPDQAAFYPKDLDYCLRELNSGFVMKINNDKGLPTIERVAV
ncbi:MAG: 2-phosphosulfolactate phosphatase [Tuberibacillus sp.]